jgi:hypothetical protein
MRTLPGVHYRSRSLNVRITFAEFSERLMPNVIAKQDGLLKPRHQHCPSVVETVGLLLNVRPQLDRINSLGDVSVPLSSVATRRWLRL